MSHPKPTPRHVPRVTAERPPAQPPTYTPHRGVIPIRPETPAGESPAVPVPVPRPARRKRALPVGKRPWRVLVVPTAAGAPTRAFDLARWQARLAIGAVVVLLLGSGGFVATLVVALRDPDFFMTSAEVAELRSEVESMQDSLALARIALMEGSVDEADSASIVAESPSPGLAAAPLAPGSRATRRPLLARSDVSMRPRLAEGLPVIGMIASKFSRARRHPLLHIVRPHLGVDVAAPSGTRISAPAAGRVTFVGRRFAVGLVVEIDHGKGVTTRYAHCRAALVKQGDTVTPGMAIATVGSSGLSTGPHLHYEVLVRGVAVDPLRYRISQAGQAGDSVAAGAVGAAAGITTRGTTGGTTGPSAGPGHLAPAQEGASGPDASVPAPGSGPS